MAGAEEDTSDIPHPRAADALTGHTTAEAALLDAYRSGRMPHAILMGGPPGIGKATLAYRLARFILAHPDPSSGDVARATSLALGPDHPVFRRVAAGTHGGLLSLERSADDKGKLRTAIVVDQVRETIPFFGATADIGGWRICIVDAVEELKSPEAPNALLKILEEPPPRSLFLLVSHAPGRVLPTIRSRCRLLNLRPLTDEDVRRVAAMLSGRSVDDPHVAAAAQAGEGSVARALMLLSGDALGLHGRVGELLERLPDLDDLALHALADAMGAADRIALQVVSDRIGTWLERRLENGVGNEPLGRLAHLSQVWEKVSHSLRDAEIYNLERKPVMFSVFGLLRDCA